MSLVIKIIVALVGGAIFWYFTEHEGKSIARKDLTPKEREYIDALAIAVYLLTLTCAALIIGGI